MFLSSHLLGEIERVCDAAAIIDRGRLVAAGSIGRLTGTGGRLIVGCTEPGAALAVLRRAGVRATLHDSGVEVVLDGEPRPAAAAVNARLLAAGGISVWRLEVIRPTLEQRFLEITSQLGAAT